MKEFVDFLGSQPPYDALSAEDLEHLAASIEVEFFAAGTVIIHDGDDPLTSMQVVRTGALEVVDRGRVVDLLGPGDTFGHVSVLSGLPPALEVRAAEDTLTYRLPDPRTVLSQPERLRFAHYGTVTTRERLTRTALPNAARSVRQVMRPLVSVTSSSTIREAAASLDDTGQSGVICRSGDDIAIATDHDFRRALAGSRSPDEPVSRICSAPVVTVPEDTPVLSAFLEMVEHGFHHLVVTGGSEQPVGVVRVVDLASAEVRDPLFVRGAVAQATSVDALREAATLLPSTAVELADSGVPPLHVAALLSAVRDLVIRRVIELAGNPADSGLPAEVSWMVLGSLARREALPTSDVDTAVAWEPSPADADAGPPVRSWAERILLDLERCGLPRCPDGANATNPLFSRSISEWQAATDRWTSNPAAKGALLLASVVADSRPITDIALGRRLTDSMAVQAGRQPFLDTLLRFTLQNRPPTGFVRDFVVEHSGEHRGELNLKRGGLLPIAGLGRWIALSTGDPRGTTPDRVQRGADARLISQDQADALVGAFEQIYRLRFEREIADLRSGRPVSSYIAPRDLDPLTRRFLRESFRTVSEIQTDLQAGWGARL